jgi:ATP:ADP antiporter, AAA family
MVGRVRRDLEDLSLRKVQMKQQLRHALPLDAMVKDRVRLLAMMGLFFLVVCAVGILRPIKNSLALDGLGATSFYKVYLVSAIVILFVPLFNRAADRVPWRWLLPGVALFFALNLVVFRLIYAEGSAWFGLVFYGWYDLFAAALVTQFFMATQLFFDARSAKKAYPLVIAGGSLGATLGGAITGFFAESVGTPNLLLVAAAFIVIFSLAMPWVWGPSSLTRVAERTPKLEMGELTAIFSNRHVRLIAASVLMTILVKQLVDFQFNALSKEVFETRDAVSAFQGKFNAATQWLPLVVLAALRPALQRWGVGAAVLLLPAAMLATTTGLAIAFGIWAAVAAKAAETSLRYSAERAGREILYIPVPDEIKLKAKAYIDVAVEKGLGKVLSAGLIALLLVFMDLRGIAVFSVVLAALWLALAVAVRREYVRTLARAIEGRFASVKGLFIALMDASSVPALRGALDSGSPLRAAFALELLAEAPSRDIRALAPELNALAREAPAEIRVAALAQLARVPELADEAVLRAGLCHGESAVREASVRALTAAGGEAAGVMLAELLGSEEAGVRTAALSHLVENGSRLRDELLDQTYLEGRLASARAGDLDARTELALASAALGDSEAARILDPFLADPDPRVLSTALRSAGLLGRVDRADRMIAALGVAHTRAAARDALVTLGLAAIPSLSRALLDEEGDERVRRAIPGVLARIPHQETVEALIVLVLAPETDQLLDFRGLKALGKLRARDPELHFDPGLVLEMAEREAEAARRYARTVVPPDGGLAAKLLAPALIQAWHERRESVFRCLGLLYPSKEVYRAWSATTTGTRARRANALEWLEQTIGHETYHRFADVLEPAAPPAPAGVGAPIGGLERDGDSWLALLARADNANPPLTDGTMDLIEKVFLLQCVDFLAAAPGAHLALLASIAEEVEVRADTVLIAEGEPTSAMFIVTRGHVALSRVGHHVSVGPEQAFGTWALIDESPSPLEARATEDTRLLRITRHDLHDLLADHSELAVALLQGLARRMRSIVA